MKRFIVSLNFALALATGSLSASAHGFHGGGFCGGGWHGGYCGYGGWHGGYGGWYGGWWPGFSISFGYPASYSYPAYPYPYYPYYPYYAAPAGGYYYQVPVQPAQPAQPAAPTSGGALTSTQTVRTVYHPPVSTYSQGAYVARSQYSVPGSSTAVARPTSQPVARAAGLPYRGTIIEYWPGKPVPGPHPTQAVVASQPSSSPPSYFVSK